MPFASPAGNTAEAQRGPAEPEPHLPKSELRAGQQASPSRRQCGKTRRCNECEKKRDAGWEGSLGALSTRGRDSLALAGTQPSAVSSLQQVAKPLAERASSAENITPKHPVRARQGVQQRGTNAVQPSWRAGAAGEAFLTAVGLWLGSK